MKKELKFILFLLLILLCIFLSKMLKEQKECIRKSEFLQLIK